MALQKSKTHHYVLNEVVILSRFAGTLMAEESFRKWEEERKEDRYRYWRMLKRARNDYLNLTHEASSQFTFEDSDFYYYLQSNYGLRPDIVDGKLGQTFTVIDEKKYMLFVLKYSG